MRQLSKTLLDDSLRFSYQTCHVRICHKRFFVGDVSRGAASMFFVDGINFIFGARRVACLLARVLHGNTRSFIFLSLSCGISLSPPSRHYFSRSLFLPLLLLLRTFLWKLTAVGIHNTTQQVSLSRPLHSDRRKLIPVAQALTDMKAVSERTAAGDLAGKRRTRSGKQVVR